AAVGGYDRGLDGYDVVEWIAQQSWCNGKVATYGGSALGVIQFQTARHQPPHLVCAVPMIAEYRNEYSNYYFGGVLRREHVVSMERLGFVTVDLITSRPVEDAYWDFIRDRNDYPEDISVPLLMVSGWFDHYPSDILRAFRDLRARSDPRVRAAHKLVMGPWTHSGVDREKQGELTFPDSDGIARDAALRFFDYHLNGAKNGWPLEPVIRYYEMGRNQWRDAEDWAALGSAEFSMYLHDDGRLDPIPAPIPVTGRTVTYDPRNPSPSHGAARFDPFNPSVVAGPLDIRTTVENRDDVLVYSSDPLSEALSVTGGIRFECSFSADRLDTDIAVRLCDVYPDGRSIILTDGIHRARFRNGTDREVLLVPNGRTSLTVTLEDIAHTFLPGHRIRLVISGSDYPRFDLNPNDGTTLYEDADTLVASITVFSGGAGSSRLVMEGPTATSVSSDVETVSGLCIHSISPQPYVRSSSPGITIAYSASPSTGSSVEVTICDMLGRPLRTLPASTGNRRSIVWDGRTHDGSIAAPGVYLLVLRQGASQLVQPVVLLQ
ncbi:MAG: CocE/NonD family hydrolase, partial [Bacteroidetes bacterium]|nr:CocE/NonD family hydrolase [Bacteroidota bacterium]